jgi:uncharacterized membrane protein YccC
LKTSLLFLLLLICTCVPAQTVRQPLMSSYPGLGAYSKNAADAFSFMVNPAALANIQQRGAGVYSER